MFKTGDIIDGRYEIKEQIGSGGGGVVYKAYHLAMKKDVAIKLIKNVSSDNLENRAEIDLMKNLKSKYLPIFYDFIESDGNVYTVMEYIDGHDIKSLSEMGRRFDESTIIRSGIQLCCAAEELHSQHPPIIHGDIKPANVMLTSADNICLIDFNISGVMMGNKATAKGYSKEYSAPEQTVSGHRYKQLVSEPIIDEYHEETRFLFDEGSSSTKMMLDNSAQSKSSGGQAYIDVQTDIYGIGAVLYYMITGHAPVNSKANFSGTTVSEKLKRIISTAMASNPSNRYSSAEKMKKALEAINMPTKHTFKDDVKKAGATKAIITAAICVPIFVAAAFGVSYALKNNGDADIAEASVNELTVITSAETTLPVTTAIIETEETQNINEDEPVKDGFVRLATHKFRIDLNKDYFKGYNNDYNSPLDNYLDFSYRLDEDTYSNVMIRYVEGYAKSESGYRNSVVDFITDWLIGANADSNGNELYVIEEYTDTLAGRECTFVEFNSVSKSTFEYDINGEKMTSSSSICISYLTCGFVDGDDIYLIGMYGMANGDYDKDWNISLWGTKYKAALRKLAEQLELGDYLDENNISIGNKTFSSDIKYLDLSNMELEDDDLINLSLFKDVEKLDLSDNKLTDISDITNLKNLVELDISNNPISQMPYHMDKLDNLKILNAADTKIDSTYSLGEIKNLEYLNLKGTNVTILSAGDNAVNLKMLILSDSGCSLYGIDSFENLEVLALDNVSLDSWDLQKLQPLTKLKKVYATNIHCSDPTMFKNVTISEALYVGHNKLSDSDIKEIQGYIGKDCKIYSDNDYDLDNIDYQFPKISE